MRQCGWGEAAAHAGCEEGDMLKGPYQLEVKTIRP